MLSFEKIQRLMGPKADQVVDLDGLMELLLHQVPYFYQQGLLTAEFLRSAFSIDRLADRQIFVQEPDDCFVADSIAGNYLVVGGQVSQRAEQAHGFFLPGTHATVWAGSGDFLGSATGVLQGRSSGAAYHQAQVTARDESCLTLHDEAFGVVTDNAQGTAADACSVQVSSYGRLTVGGTAFFLARQWAEVTASGQAFGLVCDEVELTCTSTNRVIPMGLSVSITCPEPNLVEAMPVSRHLWDELMILSARTLSVPKRKEALQRLYPNWG